MHTKTPRSTRHKLWLSVLLTALLGFGCDDGDAESNFDPAPGGGNAGESGEGGQGFGAGGMGGGGAPPQEPGPEGQPGPQPDSEPEPEPVPDRDGDGIDDGMGGAGGGGNTNVSLGGSGDLGYFRRLLNDGRVPTNEDFDAAGFFAEHHTPLPDPDCGEQVCVQAMLGVMGNLINGNNCTLLQVGLNSPIVADPNNRPPLNLSVVIDTSGSMNADGKIEFVRDGLQQLINALRDDDQLAIVTFSSSAEVLLPMIELRRGRVDAAQRVRNLLAAGGTNLHAGLEMGYQEVFRGYDSGRQNRVILLSDGNPSSGVTDAETIVTMSRGFNSDGVGLTTIGLGSDFNPTLMRTLAEQADGNAYFIEDGAAVDEVFGQEISYFTVPVAFDLELTLSEGSDYRFVRAEGSSFWEDTDDGGTLNVPSVFLAHRVAHDDIEPGGGRRGGGSALLIELMPRADEPDDREDPAESRVAEITARFREPGTNRTVEMVVPVLYPGAPWELRREGFFDNAVVEKSFVMLNIYAALVQAVDSVHLERDFDGAVGVLDRLMAAVADYEDSANDGEGDVDMQLDIELMQQLRDVIAGTAPAPPQPEDEIPEDPWPAD